MEHKDTYVTYMYKYMCCMYVYITDIGEIHIYLYTHIYNIYIYISGYGNCLDANPKIFMVVVHTLLIVSNDLSRSYDLSHCLVCLVFAIRNIGYSWHEDRTIKWVVPYTMFLYTHFCNAHSQRPKYF